MASYGLSEDELRKIITAELEGAPSDIKPTDVVMAEMFAQVIRGFVIAIEKNNAKLAEQIIAELRGGSTPTGRG
jgi:hypothetical protein